MFQKLRSLGLIQAYMVLCFLLWLSFRLFLQLKQLRFLWSLKYPEELYGAFKVISDEEWRDRLFADFLDSLLNVLRAVCEYALNYAVVTRGVLPYLWSKAATFFLVDMIEDVDRPIRGEILQSTIFCGQVLLLDFFLKLPLSLLAAAANGKLSSTFFELMWSFLQRFVGTILLAFLLLCICVPMWHTFKHTFMCFQIIASLLILPFLELLHAMLTQTFFFEGIEELGLAAQVRELCSLFGFAYENVRVRNLSQRVSAYYLGATFPSLHRIVLSKGIVMRLEPRLLLAALAREIGHWEKRHGSWMVVAVSIGLLLLATVFFVVSSWRLPYEALGFPGPEEEISPGDTPQKVTRFQPPLVVALIIVGYLQLPLLFLVWQASLQMAHSYGLESDKFAAAVMGDPKHVREMILAVQRYKTEGTGFCEPLVDRLSHFYPETNNRLRKLV